MFCRRVSAGELEDRYILKHDLFDFYTSMWATIRAHLEDKGTSWKTCKISYLKKQLKEHVKKGHWEDVANFAFFLADREKMKREKKRT